jgi:hypothetical protein
MAIPTEEFLKHQQQRLFNALIEIEEGQLQTLQQTRDRHRISALFTA